MDGTIASAATTTGPGSSSVSVVIPADQFKPFSFMGIGVILAIAISIGLGGFSLFVSMNAEREARMFEYYSVDLQMYMARNGLHPPPDPRRKLEQQKGK